MAPLAAAGMEGRTMPFPPCGQAIMVCEVCDARAASLMQLSVRMPAGRLIVVTVCSECYPWLAQRLAVMSQP